MKKYLYHLAAVALSISMSAGCSDWSEMDAIYEPDKFEVSASKSEEYYQNLRIFKGTMKDRKISWAWYGGWTGIGTDTYHLLSGLPDSLDVVSMWGGWDYAGTPTEAARRKDLEFIQTVKGTKFVATDLIGNFDEEKLMEFGWEGDLNPGGPKNSTGLFTAEVTPIQEEAIRKYARWVIERVLALGYDGYDIDYEIGYGSRGTLVEYLERLKIYVDEISKFCGPKSGTDKLFVLDGAIRNIPTPEMAYCFDWLVIQAYYARSYTVLNGSGNRLSDSVAAIEPSGMPIREIIEKIVMTEDYEGGRGSSGGTYPYTSEFEGIVNSLLGMAVWTPVYKGVRYPRSGGAGAYHVEYEYAAVNPRGIKGFYPFMREAIQRMNPANIK